MKKYELELKVSILEADLSRAEMKIIVLEKMVYTDEIRTIYGKETWQHRAERHRSDLRDVRGELKNKDKEIENLEQAQINMRSNNLKATDLLGEKIEVLQDKIKSLKGLKRYFIRSTDDYTQYTIEAANNYTTDNYTIFDLDGEEIFRIKTALITSMSTREY